MKSYTYKLNITAASEEEADSKADSLKVLSSALSAKELAALKHIVKHEPAKLAMAKAALGV